MSNNFTDVPSLLNFLQLTDNATILKNPTFSLKLPKHLAKKINKNDLTDPILKQFLPTIEETKKKKGFSQDPVEDHTFQKNKLLKKYNKRALLLCSSSCAMHCRYCFRQNFKFETTSDFDTEIKLIQKDTSLNEIILSGGDPLALNNDELKKLLFQLNSIKHLQRIRFHTRFIIGFPERINDQLLTLLSQIQKQIIFVIQVNHAQELDSDIFTALRKIQQIGIPILTQSVLLKGVNDQTTVLIQLFDLLADHGIIPYYLHQLDQVQGAHHFKVSIKKGKQLIQKLSSELAGYCIPKYVQEIPGCNSKTEIQESLDAK